MATLVFSPYETISEVYRGYRLTVYRSRGVTHDLETTIQVSQDGSGFNHLYHRGRNDQLLPVLIDNLKAWVDRHIEETSLA